MEFDECQHKITQVVLKAGAIFRELKGLPEEKNITTLFNETAPLFGIPTKPMNTAVHGKEYPIKTYASEWLPKKKCPKCGQTSVLFPICQSCKDAEGGKFKSGYTCRNEDCRFVDEKTDELIMQRLSRMKKEGSFDGEMPQGMKGDIGIRTITDEGLK